MGVIVAVLVLLIIILIVLITIPKKKGHRKKPEMPVRSAAQSSPKQPCFSNPQITKTIPKAQSTLQSSSVSESYGLLLVCETDSSHEDSCKL